MILLNYAKSDNIRMDNLKVIIFHIFKAYF